MSGFRGELDRMIEDVFGLDVKSAVIEFPSGAMDLELRWLERWVVIQGRGEEWGVSVDIPEGEEFAGHDHVFQSLEDALRFAKLMMMTPKTSDDTAGDAEGYLRNRLTETTDN
ncbi:hypothetical protein [Nocardia sp. NPDC052566]|uniref:hypothetical protein n=1 Tax=Nocardia sp. NPDC052566 TaxID=3364330 RepID=UPI0037C9E177